MKHHERAEQYCRDVLDGTVIAGQWIKRACKRHLDDLARQVDPDFEFKFSPKKANRVCKFGELLPHVKGKWARTREKIKLEPWQCFILCSIFGWLRKSDGLPQISNSPGLRTEEERQVTPGIDHRPLHVVDGW